MTLLLSLDDGTPTPPPAVQSRELVIGTYVISEAVIGTQGPELVTGTVRD